jgi:hypothetical protein
MNQAWNKSVKNSVSFNMLFAKKKNLKKQSSSQKMMLCQWISSYLGCKYLFSMAPKLLQRVSFSIPNTATVESDFSIIGWDKSDDWHDLTDFSLEGILHAKQYNNLKKLAKDLY